MDAPYVRPAALPSPDAPTAGRPALRARMRAALNALSPVAFLFVLCVPIIANVLGLHVAVRRDENRVLASAPGWPRSQAELLALPGSLTAYVSDHFGLRDAMLWLDGRLRYKLFGETASDQVLFGRHGRLFLISHEKGHPYSLVDSICGAGVARAQIDAAAADTARLLDDASQVAPRSLYVSVPTAPALYPEDLPPWLAARCASFHLTAPAVRDALAAIRPDLKARMFYAIEPMLTAKAGGEAIPRVNFHWHGLGARLVAERVAGRELGMTQARRIPAHMATALSDLARFTPGLTLTDRVLEPDYGPAGIAPCYGESCFPDLAPFAHALTEASRFRWTSGQGPRLLLISDSFGARAAGWFSEYFADVVHLNVNFALLSPEQLAALRRVLFRDFPPDVLVLMLHDGAVTLTGPLDRNLFGR